MIPLPQQKSKYALLNTPFLQDKFTAMECPFFENELQDTEEESIGPVLLKVCTQNDAPYLSFRRIQNFKVSGLLLD